MSQLGERLRHERESQGISLTVAAAETRIRLQALQALEEGQYDRLPNEVVAKGFIRNYAQFLGLSPDELLDQYRLERGATTQIQIVPATTMSRERSFVLPSFFAVFFITAAIIALAYLGLNALGQVRDDTVAQLAPPTATAAPPTPTQLGGSESSPADQPNQTGAAGTVATDTPEPEIQVLIPELEITPTARVPITRTDTVTAPIVLNLAVQGVLGEGSWLQVQADGSVVYEGILYSGQEQTFYAQQGVAISAGNPTAVLVTVNGSPPQYLGQVPDIPVFWTWPPQ
ncbi:MAG: helix-turn-helix domain-containing protein [Chloroflexaceae bacterium]|nr:helix-turn-helix domain-containing protein [Chloroflexaceae bacterium]